MTPKRTRSWRAKPVNPEKYVPAAQLASSVGVSPETVAAYAKRRAKHGARGLRKIGGRNYLHIDVADAYLSRMGLERQARRPSGWRTLKALLSDSGAGRSTAMRGIRNGELRAVLAGGTVCVHPEDAAHFVLTHKDKRPLPGWVMVSALSKELGRSKEALNQWIRRNRDTVEVRAFLHPVCNRPTPYIKEADAERYRAIVSGGSEKHVGHGCKGAEASRVRVLAAVAGYGRPVTASDIAGELGFAEDHCVRVLRRLFDEGVVTRCGRGTAHYPYGYVVPADFTKEHE